jgi:hypothetical protein
VLSRQDLPLVPHAVHHSLRTRTHNLSTAAIADLRAERLFHVKQFCTLVVDSSSVGLNGAARATPRPSRRARSTESTATTCRAGRYGRRAALVGSRAPPGARPRHAQACERGEMFNLKGELPKRRAASDVASRRLLATRDGAKSNRVAPAGPAIHRHSIRVTGHNHRPIPDADEFAPQAIHRTKSERLDRQSARVSRRAADPTQGRPLRSARSGGCTGRLSRLNSCASKRAQLAAPPLRPSNPLLRLGGERFEALAWIEPENGPECLTRFGHGCEALDSRTRTGARTCVRPGTWTASPHVTPQQRQIAYVMRHGAGRSGTVDPPLRPQSTWNSRCSVSLRRGTSSAHRTGSDP